jgi:hypothetical protein
MSALGWLRRRGKSTSRLSVFTSSLPLVIAACPNCQLETFDSSWRPFEDMHEYRWEGDRLIPPSTRRPFAMSGQLCAAHWGMLYAMASSQGTSQPSPSLPPCDESESQS